MKDNTNPLRILFLKQRRVNIGVTSYQNSMKRIFDENSNFIPIFIDEQAKIRNCLLNHIYKFMRSIPVIHNFSEYLYLITQVTKFRKKADYLCITHHFKYGLFCVFVSFLFRIPFFVSIVGWAESEFRLSGMSEMELRIRLKYESWVYRKAKYILASDDLIRGYNKIIKNENKFLRYYSPIDTDRFKPMPKSEILRDKLRVGDKKVIFTAAPLYGVKGEGVKTLLNAFALIKNDDSNVVLLIAGDGRQRKELEDLAKNLGVKNDVIFLGYCSNIPELLNLADIFALIFTFGGGIGLAIKEAMACGKPCVVSKTSGTEILRDREEVLLTSTVDPKDIADKILLLLKDEEYARRIGINAGKRIEADFSIEMVGGKLFKKLSEI